MPTFDAILTALETEGCFISDELLSPALLQSLLIEGHQRWQLGQFHDARIGRKQQLALAADIRGDSILWLDAHDSYQASQEIFAFTELLQQAFNQYFFMGLKQVELHYARYGSGTGYKRHIDQHHDTTFRKITIVIYLNPDWTAEDGGELLIYDPFNPEQTLFRVLPIAGRIVIFRSDLFEHEVLPSSKTRWSVTGWFRDDENFFGFAA